GRRFTFTLAVARQVHRQHVPAVVGQVAALQGPDAVVVEHTVDEDDRGLGGIERFAAGVAVSGGVVDGQIHGQAPAFSAAFKARLRSSIRSSASSRPMDNRMVPGPMPPAASASSVMRKWVVLAGWMTS